MLVCMVLVCMIRQEPMTAERVGLPGAHQLQLSRVLPELTAASEAAAACYTVLRPS